MFQIREWLFIGKYRESQDKALLDSRGITALLHLAAQVSQPGVISLYLPVEDGVPTQPKYFQQGVGFVREQKAAGKKVLIACGAGISRSVVFTMAALHEEEGLGLLDAYRDILTQHHEAMPHYQLWDSLCEYYGDSTGYMDMWRQIHGHTQPE
ncbi:MAG: dual specificity protein phosphatase family protein [Anaerolineae bacterium]|nr:dual specificity protein phosphatase family protein [Anaerolineae bacterium]